jgi:hypothetical protein
MPILHGRLGIEINRSPQQRCAKFQSSSPDEPIADFRFDAPVPAKRKRSLGRLKENVAITI